MIKKRQSRITTLLKLSRPGFWPYLAGPYLVAYTAFSHQLKDFLQYQFIYSLFFFLIPANIIIYGVNDLFDEDTDTFNPKKDTHEQRITANTKKLYYRAIGVSSTLSIPLFVYLPFFSKLLLGAFLIIGVFYSAEPFRLKAKPYVDSASNILYGFPAFIAIFQLTSNGLTTPVFIAIACWCAAMHLFSAIPDIEADKKAHLRTTATQLGYRTSLFVCFALWLVTAIMSILISFWLFFMLVYPVIPLLLLRDKKLDINVIYWRFIFINLVCGFLLFIAAVFLK
jgi:4-hydroxybenzoate polyprenyltransferase